MVQVANIAIKLSAEVKDALRGLRQTRAETKDMATEAQKQTGKVEGFLGKWRMGWVLAAGAAVTSLYAIAKSSGVIRGYFEEFGLMVGDVFDEIGIAMEPEAQKLLDWLWGLADEFRKLPTNVKKAIGGVIFGMVGLMTVIPILAALKASLATLGITSSVSLGIAGMSIMALGGLVAIAVGALHGYYLTWKHSWQKFGEGPGTAWAIMKSSLMGITGGIALYLAASLAHILGFGDRFQNALDRILTWWLTLWVVRIPNAVRDGVNAVIQGIGNFGDRIWTAIQHSLGNVDQRLYQWARGLLGFSPTLKEIGAMVPQTIARGAATYAGTSYAGPMPAAAGPGRYAGSRAENNITINLTVQGGVSSDHELRELARKLKEILQTELRGFGRA